MKKFFISALLLGAGIYASAQLVDIAAVSKVDLPEGAMAHVSTMSPDGSFVVMSSLVDEGLTKLDLASNEVTTLCTEGSGYDVQISKDGSSVIYCEKSVEDLLTYTSLASINTKTGAKETLVSPTRDFQGFSVSGSTVTAVEKGKVSTKGIGGVKTLISAPVVSIYRGQLYLTVNGNTELLSPQGTDGCSYLWPSISPDGTKVVYFLCTKGCFVCDLDGSNPVALGLLRAPCWLDDNTIVGMRDYDDGYAVTASSLFATNLDGSVTQQLTDDSVMAMFPSASADGSKLSFTTPDGKLYVIDINK